MKRWLFIVLFFGRYCLALATDFYVSAATGNDSFSGTSLSSAWATIGKAMESATPGSTVYIRGGIYYEQPSLEVSGTADNPITFTRYQNEVPILDGTGGSNNTMLWIEDKSYITIDGLTISNLTASFAAGVIVWVNPTGVCSHITLRNLDIHHINWTNDPNAVPTDNNNSNPLLIYGTGNAAINAATDIVIETCTVHDNITGFSESLTLNGNVNGFVVRNNQVFNNTNIGIDLAGNFGTSGNATLDHARNGSVVGNICHDNVSVYATSAGIYCDGCHDVVIERNICYGNGWGIEVGCEENGTANNVQVRSNLVYSNQEAGLAMGGYTTATTGIVTNSSLSNNTLYHNNTNNSGVGEIALSKMTNCFLRHNLLFANQPVLYTCDNISPQTFTSNYNAFYTASGNAATAVVNNGGNEIIGFANYQTTTSRDLNSLFSNPLLTNAIAANFIPQNNSPCIDAGDMAFAATTGELDFAQHPRIGNGRVDIGAYEKCVLNIAMNGNNTACANTTATYSIAPIAGSNYIWTVSNGTIQSGQGTPTIVVLWSGGTVGSVTIEQNTP